MTKLIKYEAARKALTEAVMFDEVMSIMNVAEQAALYAKQANDNDLVEKATEIRVRAQRKAGDMLKRAAELGQRASQSDGGVRGAATKHGKSAPHSHAPTLAEIGVTKEQSSHWQQLASMKDEHFEAAVATAKDTAGQVTTAFMLRAAKGTSRPTKRLTKADKGRLEQLEQSRGASMLVAYSRMVLKSLRDTESLSDQERTVLGQLRAEIDRALALQ